MGPAPQAKVGVYMQETCPLCVEELDETDKDFYPCQCGCAAACYPARASLWGILFEPLLVALCALRA